jgi:hypothetical protein
MEKEIARIFKMDNQTIVHFSNPVGKVQKRSG